MATRMQQRKGTAAQWISTNSGNGPVLNAGEIGFELDTNKFKIGDGVNHWVDLVYFTDSASALAAINAVIDAAPAALNTLNELAAAINDDPAFFTTIATNLSNHESDTTNVHGIGDTSALATKTYADSAVSTHSSDTTNVHGISNTADLATQDYVTDAIANSTDSYPDLAGDGLAWDAVNEAFDVDGTIARLESPTFTGTVSGITKAMVGLDAVDNSSDQDKPISTATQTALDLKAPINSPTFTGTVSGVTKSMVGLGNVDNTSDANKQISDATQDALDLKAPIESPSFTGTVSGVTKAMVGLGNVDNTADLDKPSSTDTLVRLDGKANIAGPTFTGTVTVPVLNVQSTLNVVGDLTVSGTTTTVNATDLVVTDPLIYIGEGNEANLVDLGLVASFDNGTYQHTGIARDASADKWKLFKGVTTEPTTVINFSEGSLDDLEVGALEASSLTVGSVSNTEISYLNGVTSSIQNQIDDKLEISTAESTYAPLVSPTFSGTVVGITKTMVGLGNVDNTTDANKPVSTATQAALDLKLDIADAESTYAPLNAPTFTGTVSGITKSMVGLGNVDNTSDANKPISTATQTALDAKLASATAATTYATISNVALKAPINSPTFTGTVSGITKAMVGLSDVDNTTDADKPVSSATQTALNLKAPLANPTFTGTVSGITKSMVGLGSVDNTSDADKPVSSATQTALNLKANTSDVAELAQDAINTAIVAGTGLDKSYNDVGNTITLDIDSTVATLIGTQTLINKTLTSPVINTPTGITKSDVGLSNVDNTADINKPISSAAQAELNLKLDIADAESTYAPLNAPTFTGTVSGITKAMVGLGSADNTSDADKPISDDTQAALDLKAPLANPTFTGTVSGITKTMVGLANVDNTSDASKPISTATQNALDLKAPLASPTFTGTVTLPLGTVTSGMILDGTIVAGDLADGAVTSAKILDGTIVNGDINASAAIDWTKLAISSTVSATEAGYLDGVTSAIQTQINGKASLSGATFTGSVEIDQNLVVDGNLTVNGTTFNASSTSITIEDNLVQLAHQNSANTVDLGLVVGYNDGAAKHSGIVRDVSADKWKLFKGVTTEPTTTVDFTQGSLDDLEVAGLTASSLTVGSVSNTEIGYLDGVTSAIQTQINTKAPTASPTFTGTVTIPNGAALGTPASATLTNATGLPVSTGVSGLGTGVSTFLATPSSANFASMITDEIGTGNVVLSEVATNAQTASYTLVAADRGKMVEMNVASGNTLTVPLNSSVAFPVGTKIDILQVGAGQVTVAGTAGVTVNATPGLKIRAQWGSATLIKRATDTWVLVGDLSA